MAYKMVVVFYAVAGLSAELRSKFDEIVLFASDSIINIPDLARPPRIRVNVGSIRHPRAHVQDARLDKPRSNEEA